MPAYEISSDKEQLSLQPDDPADGGSALDDLQPQEGPPILQQPPALPPFDFRAIMRRRSADQAGIQAHCWPQFEKLMHIYHLGPSMYTVNELEEL